MQDGSTHAALYQAAATAYQLCQPKLQLAQYLINQMTAPNGRWVSPVVDVHTAAANIGLTTEDMLQLLRNDPCFKVFQPVPSAATSLTLDQTALLMAGGQVRLSGGGGGDGGYTRAEPPQAYQHPGGHYGMHHAGHHLPPPRPHPGQVPWQQQQQQHGPMLHMPHQPRAPPPPALSQGYGGFPPGQHHAMVGAPAGPFAGSISPRYGSGHMVAGGGGVPLGMQQQHPHMATHHGHMQQGMHPSTQHGYPQHNWQQQQQQQQYEYQQQQQVPRPLPPGQQQQLQLQPVDAVDAHSHQDNSAPVSPAGAASSGFHQGMHAAADPHLAAGSAGKNKGSVLLAALQGHSKGHIGDDAASSSRNALDSPGAAAEADSYLALMQQDMFAAGGVVQHNSGSAGAGSSQGAESTSTGVQGSNSSSSQRPSETKAPAGGGVVHPKGVYLQGIPANTTRDELQAVCAAYGQVVNVIITIKYHTTKCAFVDFATEAAAQQALSDKTILMDGCLVRVLPKVVKGPKAQTGDGGSALASPQNSKQQGTAGAASSSAAAAGGNKKNPKLLGKNEDGLPQLRGAPCCPYYLGTGLCRFGNACKYHHPSYTLHPECIAAGKLPQRYNVKLMPSYARLVNFTERLWDYTSSDEARLKIWLARHLLAKENSGCGMFDESAAVPAAHEEAVFPDPSQPLGPYSCGLEEAGQVLQLLWKAQPDDASKQDMPYKGGALRELLRDDPYYDYAADGVRLRVSRIKELLNF